MAAAILAGCASDGRSAETVVPDVVTTMPPATTVATTFDGPTATTGTDPPPTSPPGGTPAGSAPATTSSVEPSVAPAATPGPAVDGVALQQWLDDWRAGRDVLGAVVGLQVGDEPPVIVASGRSDPDRDDPLDPQAPFFIASVTKTFVTAIVMELAEDGQVDLDEPVSRYVEVPGPASTVTLRQLLSHTSGLPSLANLDSRDRWEPLVLADLDRRWTGLEALGEIADDPLLFAAGTDYHYSNANFIVAGLVVEAVTGRPLADELRDRITAPLGLADTVFDPGTDPLDPRLPHGIYVLPDGSVFDTADEPLTAVLSLLGAAGAMVSTPADLLRWMPALYGDDGLLSPESRQQLYDVGSGRGLGTKGICPCTDDGPLGRGHDGLFPGFTTWAAHYPSADVSVVMYVDEGPLLPSELEDALTELVAPWVEP